MCEEFFPVLIASYPGIPGLPGRAYMVRKTYQQLKVNNINYLWIFNFFLPLVVERYKPCFLTGRSIVAVNFRVPWSDKGEEVMGRTIQPHEPENSHGGFHLFSRLRGLSRWPILLAALLSLSACSGMKMAILENHREIEIEQKRKIRPNLPVVLRTAPRRLMVAPRDEYVWLWDRPGGMFKRAMRIKKLPSGTIGRVLEYEPEDPTHLMWAEEGFPNIARQPIRWVRVATFKGTGWVRAEFIDPR